MINSEVRIHRFGAITFITAGVLFFAANLLTITFPNPPSGETEFLNWLSDNRIWIAIQNEVLFFATMCLIPSSIVLHKLLRNRLTISSILGIGLMAIAIPILGVINLFIGRLVYPVYDIKLSVDALKLMLSLFHGGMHAVALIFAVSIIATGFAVRGTIFPRLHLHLSLLAGVLQVVFSYEWLIGTAFSLIAILFFSLWLVINGVYILSRRQELLGLNKICVSG